MFDPGPQAALERQRAVEAPLPALEVSEIVVVDHRVGDPVASARAELIPGTRAVVLDDPPSSDLTFDPEKLREARFHFTLTGDSRTVSEALSAFVRSDRGLASCTTPAGREALIEHASGVLDMLVRVSGMESDDTVVKAQLLVRQAPAGTPEPKRHNAAPEGHVSAIHAYTGGALCVAPDPGVGRTASSDVVFEVPLSCTTFVTNGRLTGCMHSFLPGEEPAVILKVTQESKTAETAQRVDMEMRALSR